MSTPEEKDKRRRRIKRRSTVVRDLHSAKYRQRIIRGKKYCKVRPVGDLDLFDDDDFYLDDLMDGRD